MDTSSLPTDDAIAQAVAAEHGAPGENEQIQYVLVGESASEGLAGHSMSAALPTSALELGDAETLDSLLVRMRHFLDFLRQ